MQQPKYLRTLLIGEAVHFLNNSRSKYVCIGLSPQLNFTPAVVIGGGRVSGIILRKEDWQSLLDLEGVLLSYFTGGTSNADSISTGNINIYFGEKAVKIEDSNRASIILGEQSVEALFKLNIDTRLEELQQKQFGEFYIETCKRIRNLPGEIKSNLNTVLQQIQADDKHVRLMLEAVDKVYPRVISDIETCSA